MDEKTIIDESYHSAFTVMKFMGIYPADKPSTFRKVFFFVMYLILQVIPVILTFIPLMLQDNLDIVESLYMIVFVEGTGMTSLQIIKFFTDGEKLKKCINHFGHPRFKPQDEYERKLTEHCVLICSKTCSFILVMLPTALIFWFISAFLSFGSSLPVDAWLPYDPFSNNLYFLPTFIFIMIANTYSITVSTVPHALIATLSFHVTTQLKILKYNLRNLHKFTEEGTENELEIIPFEKIHKVLVRCIDLHNDILHFIEEYEECFSWSILCQIVVCVIILCTCATGMSFAPFPSLDFFKCVNYYSVTALQTFFYCLFGTLLAVENDSFIDAICEGPWYRYDTCTRKFLFIIMERSKRPMVITAGKVIHLGFNLYVTLIRTSYSLIALLKNM